MNGLILICAGLLAAGVTFITNSLALGPWRRSRNLHWSEQARLLYPARTAARTSLVCIPGLLALSVAMLWPDSSPLWFFTGIIALVGAYAGTLPMDHEIFPRITRRELLREAAIGLGLRVLVWSLFIWAAVLMPNQFDTQALAIAGLVIGLRMLLSHGDPVWLGRKLGWLLPIPARLQTIVDDTSARMNVPVRKVVLIRSRLGQAYAVLGNRQVMFTERLLEILSDEELASVCAHELAHLTEPKSARYARNIQLLTFLPWIFFNPMVHQFGFLGFYGLVLLTFATPRIFRRISRKLETRADAMATVNQGDEGTYARALARLYEDSLIPVVTAKSRATHPHLYDRMVSAGVTPDFPRPRAAKTMSWHGHLFGGMVGLLLVVYVIRLLHLLGA